VCVNAQCNNPRGNSVLVRNVASLHVPRFHSCGIVPGIKMNREIPEESWWNMILWSIELWWSAIRFCYCQQWRIFLRRSNPIRNYPSKLRDGDSAVRIRLHPESGCRSMYRRCIPIPTRVISYWKDRRDYGYVFNLGAIQIALEICSPVRPISSSSHILFLQRSLHPHTVILGTRRRVIERVIPFV